MAIRRTVEMWAGLWRSQNRLDGRTEHLLFHGCMPQLFRTRAEAREFIKKEYGYLADRPDLKREPHGWKIPIAIRVKITISPQQQDIET